MFKASIHFANRDGFYKTGGYEKIYNIAGKFKNVVTQLYIVSENMMIEYLLILKKIIV